jgi:hypothetical protein
MTPILNTLTWIVNGFLVIVFFLTDRLATVLILGAAGAFVFVAPSAQRPWAIGASVLAITASLIAPAPVPVFLVVVALVSAAALYLEHYNRPAALWNVVRGVSLYSLAGLGYALWKGLHVMDRVQGDSMMVQGANYVNAIIGIAMYVFPLGIVVLLAQSVLAHPPVGKPEDILNQVRTRGKDR